MLKCSIIEYEWGRGTMRVFLRERVEPPCTALERKFRLVRQTVCDSHAQFEDKTEGCKRCGVPRCARRGSSHGLMRLGKRVKIALKSEFFGASGITSLVKSALAA